MQLSAVGFGPIRASHLTGFVERFLGLKSSLSESAVLINTRSVHSFGMKRSIGVVAIDARSEVVGLARLRPNRVIWFRRARAILELPDGSTLPQIGARITVEDV